MKEDGEKKHVKERQKKLQRYIKTLLKKEMKKGVSIIRNVRNGYLSIEEFII